MQQSNENGNKNRVAPLQNNLFEKPQSRKFIVQMHAHHFGTSIVYTGVGFHMSLHSHPEAQRHTFKLHQIHISLPFSVAQMIK